MVAGCLCPPRSEGWNVHQRADRLHENALRLRKSWKCLFAALHKAGESFIRAKTSLSWLNSEKLPFRLTKSPLVSGEFFSQHLLYGIRHQGLRFHELQGTTAIIPSLLLDKPIPIKTEQSRQNFVHEKPPEAACFRGFAHFEVSIISWRTAAHDELPSSRTSFSPSFSGLS